MKCQVPQISWHGRNPVLSIDFQPVKNDILRLASGGTDSHVLIWYVTYEENKSVKLECASDLYRHNKSVNVVRFSPNGEFLASGDDEGAMFIWSLRERDQVIELPSEDENMNKEDWYPAKLLRGHLDDIYDICWSKDGNYLVSSSMDNTVIIWDMQKYTKIHIFSDFKGYVQGVTWDPLNQFIASVGSDRTLRIHNINSKKSVYKLSKAPWTNETEKGTFKAKLFYDDTLQSYFRRLTFTPDGELLIVPSGIMEKGEKTSNTCYIFSRHALNKPVITLPTGDKYTVAVKCNPFLYKLRGTHDASDKENKVAKPLINLPYRMIFAVAACESVLLYDTEQLLPFAYVSNIHYTHLTDFSWSPDGLTLVVSSTDGYCSFISFTREELGDIYIPEKPKDIVKETTQVTDASKVEKMNESSSVISTTNSEIKNSNTPITPKRIVPVPAKSPRVVSGTKDENVTPSSKIAKNVSDSKKMKTPKMCSIKKFFISPKTVAPVSVSNESTKPLQSSTVKKESAATEVREVIDLTDTPVKSKDSENTDNVSKQIDDQDKVVKNISEVEPMETGENLAETVLPAKRKSPSTGSEKHSKCKVRLDFADKDQLIANIDDNASDNSVSCETPADNTKNDLKQLDEAENDWKLELSQDDEIIPMETASSVSETKPDLPKNFSDVSPSAGPSTSRKVTVVVGKSPLSKTPKRRVPFVTLSSKISKK